MNPSVEATACLPGYRLIEQLHQGTRTTVYRGIRLSDQQDVVIKFLQCDYPTFSELVRFRNQYTIAKNLHHPGIVRPLSLEPYQNGYALIMEDFGGVSLRKYLTHCAPNPSPEAAHPFTPLPLAEFWQLALQLCNILHYLHQNRVIHKDINPANILMHPQTQQIKVGDFSIASLLPKETQEIQSFNALEGSLAYLSPEQTGRMNRGIDYRSDFYALGVTLFEVLTGQLPFPTEDALELIHCHIARPVPSVCDRKPEIPPIVGAIVRKLMAKNAEERYQSALGLKYDLELCFSQWQTTGEIRDFQLGQRDACDRFLVPEKLYGREAEVKTLLAAFDRVAAGASEIMLVAGFSGIGKTAVVNEVHKPLCAPRDSGETVQQRGYFIKGKFDQLNRNLPFSAIVQALRDLMGQLLSESDEQLQTWRSQILAAVGDNGQVLIEVIPELEQIIGAQPPAIELSGTAAQNRFNFLFQKFIRVFATPAHPLVMFLDDLQWADSASLSLMQWLMAESKTSYLLVIGAYRNNEVSPVHPLLLTLEALKQAGATLNTIVLSPLTAETLNRLVADTFNCAKVLAQPLTNLVMQKTQGNPFFATQFLKALHQEGWIEFNVQAGHWQCDIVRVREAALTDDVVEFMALQLQKLPVATQEVLKLAACVGNQFDLNTLAIVSEQSEVETATMLWTALQQGLILPMSEIYKLFHEAPESRESERIDNAVEFWILDSGSCTYRFLHDRVQQAAYSLAPEAQRAAIHLQIGRLLLNHTRLVDHEEKLFALTNQFNAGVSQILDPIEREHVAEMNLHAGRKAKAATAHSAALDYLTIGQSLLPAQSWQTHYELTLAFHHELTEVAYLTGQFDQMDYWAKSALAHADSLLDKVAIYEIQIQAYSARNQFKEALQLGLTTLQQLGVSFPETVGQAEVGEALEEMQQTLAENDLSDLLTLPVMGDRTSLAAMRLMSSLGAVIYFIAPAMFPLLILRQLRLSIHHGNTAVSTYTYAWCGVFINIERGSELGQLALHLLQRLNAKAVQAKTYFTVYVFIHHWKAAIAQTLTPLLEAYQAGLETGDLEFASYSIIHRLVNAYFIGQELDALEKEVSIARAAIAQMHQENAYNSSGVYHQAILNLLGRSNNTNLLIGTAYDEAQMLPFLQQNQDITSLQHLYLHKLILDYLFGDYEQAIESANQSEQYLDSVPGIIAIVLHHFYAALSKLAVCRDRDPETQTILLQQVEQHQAKLQSWATSAPMNYQQKFELVEAERQRVRGDRLGAIEFYDRAIASAQANGFIHEVALANELTAKFYLDWGKEKLAVPYLQDAYYGYAKWGAKAKTDDLETHYPHLLASILHVSSPIISPFETTASQSSHPTTALDLATILQACQTLSSTIELDPLLQRLIQLVATNAGADKAVLFLNQNGSLKPTIQYADGTTQFLDLTSVDDCQQIAIPLVHYVEHTLETVITNYNSHSSTLNDAYCLQAQPQSLLCLPILKQGQLLAVVYLENAITANAFTDDRVELLNVLCTQAAISLENAQLYQQAQTTAQQLETSLIQLQTSETRFRHLGNNLPGAIFQMHLTPDGKASIPYVSSGCYDLYEVSAEEMMSGQYGFREFEHPEDAPLINQKLMENHHTLNLFRMEFRIITRSGQLKWIQVASQLTRESDGSMRVDGVILDVTERVKLEAERKTAELQIHQLNAALEQQNRNLETLVEQRTADLIERTVQLEASNQELESFSYSVSHDLRAPLRHIHGFVNALRQRLDHHTALADPKVAHYIQVIDNSSQKMAQLIDGLLTLSRIGRKPMVQAPVRLQDLVEEAINLVQGNSHASPPAEFVIGDLPTVQGDAALLQQVLSNLIQNAVKFSRNQPYPQVEIGCLPEGTIFVRDNGVGFQMQYADKLFGAFQRLHSQAEFEGTGIGLAIVQRIIHRHNGRIWAESQPNQGTTFFFTIGHSSWS